MTKIKFIDYINISVADIEECKSFFTGLLDFRLDKEGWLEGDWMDRTVGLKDVKAKYTKLILPGAETSIELIQYFYPKGDKDSKINEPNRIGFRHIAFEV